MKNYTPPKKFYLNNALKNFFIFTDKNSALKNILSAKKIAYPQEN